MFGSSSSISEIKKVFDLLPGIWSIIDTEGRYLYCNDAFVKFAGFENLDKNNMIGKTRNDLPISKITVPDHYWRTDRIVIQSKKTVSVIHAFKDLNNNWRVFRADKHPIVNSETKEVDAIIIQFMDLAPRQSLNLMLAFAKDKSLTSISKDLGAIEINLNDQKRQHIELKPKEYEYLFYLSRGVSYKEISRIQNVTYRTVIDYVNRLKVKFNVNTTTQLINQAIIGGYDGLIPKNTFSQPMLVVLKNEDNTDN